MEEKVNDKDILTALKQASEGFGSGYIGDLYKDTLDLIHHLQAEIERLTEWKDKLQDTKDELEQQLIDTGFKEYCEENERLTKVNAELQKQVDELKEQRDVFKRLFESVNTSNVSTNCIIETMNSFYREQAEHLAGLKIEQAVKDTAKEIFMQIFESCVFSFKGNDDYKKGFCDALEQYDKQLRDLAKQKGVEVE